MYLTELSTGRVVCPALKSVISPPSRGDAGSSNPRRNIYMYFLFEYFGRTDGLTGGQSGPWKLERKNQKSNPCKVICPWFLTSCIIKADTGS